MPDSLRPHGLQHARPPCPSPTPEVYSNSCPLSRWCHQTISSSVVPFSACPQSFPASGSFQMSQLFTSGGQTIGVSASASVLPMNIQGWFLLGLIDLLAFQLSLVAQSCLTVCDPMDYSTSGFPVLHHLPELVQTHVHWVSEAIQPSHPLSSSPPPALNLPQHQSLFQWVGSSQQVAKVLELQHGSFQ